MSILKIGVYQICKNEINYIKKWYDSIKNEQDGIFVTDTGSIDGSLELLKSLPGVTVFEQKIIPWRFDSQRNISLQNVPDDYDVLVCLDMDETLEQGWKKNIQLLWNNNLNSIIYKYINLPNSVSIRSKIHRRSNAYWVSPIHEYTKFNDRIGVDKNNKSIFADNIIVYHDPDLTKPRHYPEQMLYWLSTDEFKNDEHISYFVKMEYEMTNDYKNIRKYSYDHLNISYRQDPNNIDTVNMQMRSETMNSIQRSIIFEHPSDKLSEKDITDQLQWIMRQTSERADQKDNWIFQQRLWGMLGNYSMVYACCKQQIWIYNIDDQWSIQQNRLTNLDFTYQMLKYQEEKLKKEL